MPVETRIEFDQGDVRRLVARLSREADGRALKRDLVAGFTAAAQPAAAAAQGAILSMPSRGYSSGHASLRGAIAAGIKVEPRLGGRYAGVSIRAHRVRLRGFYHAPKRTNRDAGWTHPVFGHDRIPRQHQTGLPGWFDTTVEIARPGVRRAAGLAAERMLDRIAGR